MSDAVEDVGIHSDLLYTRVAGMVFGQPLLVMPDVAETVGNYIRSRMEGAKPEANRFVGRPAVDQHSGAWKGYRRAGPVGIISIMGELVNRGAWLGASSGLTSYEGIIEQARAAANDADVTRNIILDINSPGGEAYGMADAARSIRSIAQAAGKRVIAVINSVGASAAYGLASAADEIVVTESGVAGSIGVVLVHYDISERASKLGVRATVITAGKNKATGHPFAPLDEESRSHLQAKIDRIMDGFVKLVTDHRAGLTSEAVRGFEANTFIGADAVTAGLADRVGTFDSVLAELSTNAPRGRSTVRSSAMTDTVTKADHDAGVAKARDEGKAQGFTEGKAAGITEGKAQGFEEGKAKGLEEGKAQGAQEAATRIGAILDHENAQGREQLARHLAFQTQMPADAAVAALAAAPKDAAGGSLSERMKGAPGTETGAPPAAGGDKDKPVDARERGRQIAMQAKGKTAA